MMIKATIMMMMAMMINNSNDDYGNHDKNNNADDGKEQNLSKQSHIIGAPHKQIFPICH